MIYHHQISPWLFRFGDQALSWYWASYFLGFLLVVFLGLRLVDFSQKLTRVQYLRFLQWSFPAMIISSRLFYILVYHPQFFWDNPSLIPQFWRGGMSFHGALIGPLFCALYLANKHKHCFFAPLDHVLIPASAGLFFGRLGNFINGELAGIPTNQQWGVVFSGLYDQQLRHPVQLYQAASEGALLFLLLLYFGVKKQALKSSAKITSLFLIGYGSFRLFTEFWREADPQLGKIIFLNLGQWLCLLMILAGLFLYRSVSRTTRYSASKTSSEA